MSSISSSMSGDAWDRHEINTTPLPESRPTTKGSYRFNNRVNADSIEVTHEQGKMKTPKGCQS